MTMKMCYKKRKEWLQIGTETKCSGMKIEDTE